MSITKLTPEDFIFMEKEVVKFNSIMSNSLEDETLKSTYHKLSIEEIVQELLPAYEDNNKIEILDALVDGVFVVFYWALLSNKGFSLEYNLRWLREYVCIQKEKTSHLCDIIKNLTDCVIYDSVSSAQTRLCVLLAEYQDEFDIMGAFREVLRSNLSKFTPASNVDIDGEVAYIESVGRYGDITVDEIETEDGMLLAFRAGKDLQSGVTFGKPKLIKPRSFSEPQLEQFIL